MRKQLGFTFLGETRDADRFLLADLDIEGLGSEVPIISLVLYEIDN